jgi:hypothetical protein
MTGFAFRTAQSATSIFDLSDQGNAVCEACAGPDRARRRARRRQRPDPAVVLALQAVGRATLVVQHRFDLDVGVK